MSTINQERIAEDIALAKWERDLKNKIINITDPVKKQKLWSENFPVMTLSDEWLNEAEVF